LSLVVGTTFPIDRQGERCARPASTADGDRRSPGGRCRGSTPSRGYRPTCTGDMTLTIPSSLAPIRRQLIAHGVDRAASKLETNIIGRKLQSTLPGKNKTKTNKQRSSWAQTGLFSMPLKLN